MSLPPGGIDRPDTSDPRYPAFSAWAEGALRSDGDAAWAKAWLAWRRSHPLPAESSPAIRPRPRHTPCNPGWPKDCCAGAGMMCAAEPLAGVDARVCERCGCRWDWPA